MADGLDCLDLDWLWWVKPVGIGNRYLMGETSILVIQMVFGSKRKGKI